jgi:hypothetical protein
MAKVYGVPGEWARVKGTICGLWPLFLSVFAVGASFSLLLVYGKIGFILLVASFVSVWLMLLKGMRHVERFYKGARGEEKVSGILADLPSQYRIFNDFKADSHHVDHVVAGPAGVFSIETKFWSDIVTIEEGHVLVGGKLPSRSPVAQARREAQAVKVQLEKLGWKGDVVPVLAFASDTFKNKVEEIQGVVILNSCELKKCFEAGRTVLETTELERIVSLMENNS